MTVSISTSSFAEDVRHYLQLTPRQIGYALKKTGIAWENVS